MTAKAIIEAIANCFYIYGVLICIRCLLTWFPNMDWDNPIIRIIKDGADVYLNLFKKIIPPIGPFDFSPVIALFALMFIRNAVIFVAVIILQTLGA